MVESEVHGADVIVASKKTELLVGEGVEDFDAGEGAVDEEVSGLVEEEVRVGEGG